MVAKNSLESVHTSASSSGTFGSIGIAVLLPVLPRLVVRQGLIGLRNVVERLRISASVRMVGLTELAVLLLDLGDIRALKPKPSALHSPQQSHRIEAEDLIRIVFGVLMLDLRYFERQDDESGPQDQQDDGFDDSLSMFPWLDGLLFRPLRHVAFALASGLVDRELLGCNNVMSRRAGRMRTLTQGWPQEMRQRNEYNCVERHDDIVEPKLERLDRRPYVASTYVFPTSSYSN